MSTKLKNIDLLSHFNIISQKLESTPFSIISIQTLSNIFNLSYKETIYILNEFIIHQQNIDNIIIFFLAELNEPSINEIQQIIIPSYFSLLQDIIENKNNTTLSLSVYALCKNHNDFALNDFTALFPKSEVISKYDFDTIELINKPQITKEVTMTNDDEDINHISQQVKQVNVNNEVKPKKVNVFEDKDENYYKGFVPKQKANKTKSKSKSRSVSKERIVEEKPKTKVTQSVINEDVEMKDDNVNEGNVKEEKKRVKVIKRVKETQVYQDENGYLLTQDVWVDKEVSEDEDAKEVKRPPPVIPPIQDAQKKRTKKREKAQGSILSFLSKV